MWLPARQFYPQYAWRRGREAAGTSNWWEDTDYDLLTSVMDFNEDRYALPAWGSELVTNGGFDTDTGWTKATNVTISGGTLNIGTTVANFAVTSQNISLTSGKLYAVTYTFTRTAGSTVVRFNSGTGHAIKSASGTYTEYFTAGVTASQIVVENAAASSNYTIDNVSVREVILTPTGRTYGGELLTNGDFATGPTLGSELLDNGNFATGGGADPTANWVLSAAAGGSSATIGSGILTLVADGTNSAHADQNFVTTNGQIYELTLTTGAGGGVVVSVGTSQAGTQLLNPTVALSTSARLRFTATGALTWIRLLRVNAATVTVDDVSVKEFTQPSGWTLKVPNIGYENSNISGGTLNLTGDGTNAAYADQSFATTNLQIYEIVGTSTGGNCAISLGTSQGGTSIVNPATGAGLITSGTTTIYKFVATGTTTWLRLSKTSTGTAAVDNVSIRALTAIGVYPKREATFEEAFSAYAASSTWARTYTDNTGTLKTMADDPYLDASILTNGDFSSGVTGWTSAGFVGGTDALAPGLISESGGQLTVSNDATTDYARAVAQITTVNGASYRLDYQITGGTSIGTLRVSTSSVGATTGQVLNVASIPLSGTYYFTAAATTYYVSLINSGTTNTETLIWDNITVKPINSVNARRLTYANGKRQLRLENAATNLCLRSHEFSNAYWTKNGVLSLASGVTSPAGDASAFTLIPTTSAVEHNIVSSGITVSNATAYTFSIYAKAAGWNWLLLYTGTPASSGAWFNVGSGVVGSKQANVTTHKITPVGNGWYRCEMTVTTSGTGQQLFVDVVNADSALAPAGDGTSGVSLWGAQLEASAFATDYIPTTTGTVTRAIETARLSPLLEAVLQWAQGSVVVRGDLSNTAAASRRLIGTDTDKAPLYARSATNQIASWNGSVDLLAGLGSGSNNDPMGAAIGFDAAGRSIAANGGTVGSDAGGPGTRTTIYLARSATIAANEYGDGYYDFLGISPERQPDANLRALAVPAFPIAAYAGRDSVAGTSPATSGSVAIGSESVNRLVIVGLMSANDSTFTAMTATPNTGSPVVMTKSGEIAAKGAAFFQGIVPTGTTATFTATGTGIGDAAAIYVWTVNQQTLDSLTGTVAGATHASNLTATATLDTTGKANGFILAIGGKVGFPATLVLSSTTETLSASRGAAGEGGMLRDARDAENIHANASNQVTVTAASGSTEIKVLAAAWR